MPHGVVNWQLPPTRLAALAASLAASREPPLHSASPPPLLVLWLALDSGCGNVRSHMFGGANESEHRPRSRIAQARQRSPWQQQRAACSREDEWCRLLREQWWRTRQEQGATKLSVSKGNNRRHIVGKRWMKGEGVRLGRRQRQCRMRNCSQRAATRRTPGSPRRQAGGRRRCRRRRRGQMRATPLTPSAASPTT